MHLAENELRENTSWCQRHKRARCGHHVQHGGPCKDTDFESKSDGKSREGLSREVACSDLGFQRITLVDASNRLEGGKAETPTSYYNGVATGITTDCIHPY